MPDDVAELESVGAWQFFQDMLRDTTTVVTQDAEAERELLMQRMRDFLAAHPSDGGHGRYTWSDTALDASEVSERVRRYQDRYDISSEQLR